MASPSMITDLPDGPRSGQVTPSQSFTPTQRWMFLAILFLIVTVSYMDRYVLPVVLELIKHEFALSDTMLGLLSGVPFTICYSLFALPFARLADTGNRKKVLVAALLVWSAMTALCGVATSVAMLFVARMGVGAGEGGSTPPAHALVVAYFPSQDRGKAFAVLTATSAVGSFAALLGGGWVGAHYGWRMAFIITSMVSIPIALLAMVALVEPRARVPIGQNGQNRFWPDVRTLCAKRSYLLLIIGAGIYGLFVYGPIGFVPTYLVRIMKLDLAMAGRIYGIATAVGTLVGAIGGGFVIDAFQRRDVRWLLRLPALGVALAFPLSVIAFSATTLWLFFIAIALLFALLSAVLPALFAAVQWVCGDRRRATAIALYMMMLNLVGATFGPILTGWVSDLLQPSFGTLALRYALILTTLPLIPPAVLFWRAAGALAADAEA